MIDLNHRQYRFISLLSLRLIALFALLISHNAFSCSRTITVSVPANWPPFSFYENNTHKGLDIEILEHVLSKANLCWHYVSYPSSSRAFLEFEKGFIDLIFAASYNEERSQYATFSTPYRNETMQLFTHVTNNEHTELSSNTTVAVNRGSYYGALFEQYKKHNQECIIETSLVKERMNLIKFKRVDFAIEELLSASHVVTKLGISDLVKATNITVNNNPVHFMLNPNGLSQNEVAAINKAIKDSDNTIYNLVKKYHSELIL